MSNEKDYNDTNININAIAGREITVDGVVYKFIK